MNSNFRSAVNIGSMSNTSMSNAAVAPMRRLMTLSTPRTVLVAGLLVAIAGGLIVSRGAVAYAGDAELALLLRFMGVIKLLTAAAAASLLMWRLKSPLSPRLCRVAIVACWCLAMGATLITSLAYLMPAIILFHVGLLSLIVVALLEGRPARR
ncbi:MAG: hypothetical protein ABR612_14000 [Chromatocurvus sp.]